MYLFSPVVFTCVSFVVVFSCYVVTVAEAMAMPVFVLCVPFGASIANAVGVLLLVSCMVDFLLFLVGRAAVLPKTRAPPPSHPLPTSHA